METCTPHFRMKQNRKIGNVVLIKPTPKKKKECMRFQPIASQKMTQTHQISSTVVERIWYTDTPIKHYQFTRFMHDIFINVKCSTTYTANCLRANAIQQMNDAGLELRNIMHMSGHKNEASVIATVQSN